LGDVTAANFQVVLAVDLGGEWKEGLIGGSRVDEVTLCRLGGVDRSRDHGCLVACQFLHFFSLPSEGDRLQVTWRIPQHEYTSTNHGKTALDSIAITSMTTQLLDRSSIKFIKARWKGFSACCGTLIVGNPETET
jgi:hypothetical protein